MDSRLMNVVYDDPFDGNYTKYENDTDFWSSGSDTMGMQLTETLHGILPIAPTADDFKKDDNVTTNTLNLHNNKNSFNYEGFAEHHFSSGGGIEIVTADPNAEGFHTDCEDEDDKDNNVIDFDRLSQSSSFTFRTRTDSSSIGDYESHTSDYDEDDDDIEDEGGMTNVPEPFQAVHMNIGSPNEQLINVQSGLLVPDDLILPSSAAFQKCRTFSTNTISSDADGLELNIDANNFDLAEFITKDDLPINTSKIPMLQSAINTTNSMLNNNSSLQADSTLKRIDSDSDSDVIVDVETVEFEDDDNVNLLRKASDLLKSDDKIKLEEDYLTYIDNVSTDPSWCPNQAGKKLEEKCLAQKESFIKHFTIVPNKKQCDLLKGKYAKGKTKPIQKGMKISKPNQIGNLPKNNEAKNHLDKKTGIGMGGKNLALLKNVQGASISENSSEENSTPNKSAIKQHKQSSSPTDITKIRNSDDMIIPAQMSPSQSVKRKLNLEEYKMRRCDPLQCVKKNIDPCKIVNLENNTSELSNSNVKKPVSAAVPFNHSKEVTSIVKTLKEQQQQQVKNSTTDPITEAKNKVLRMQELKKAQQLRIIDSTISAKVPRVTKVLPLREIVKDTPYGLCNANAKQFNCNPDYEEIIVVSASCNTEISLPPILCNSTHTVNTATRSLLKSTALLTSVSDTFQKAKATDNLKISANSLIVSIQNVVVKKTHAAEVQDTINNKCDLKDQTKAEHGEDKIIMHLRKDRIRKATCTIGTQTDFQPEFPPMPITKTDIQHKSRERVRRKKHKHRQYRKHKEHSSSSSSSDSDNSSGNQSDRSYSSSSSLPRSHDNSCSSSIEGIRVYDSAIGTGGYSSRSSRKHGSSVCSSHSGSIDRVARGRRQRRTSFKQRSKRSQSPYSSSSCTSHSDRSRSPLYRRSRSRSHSRATRRRRTSYRQNNSNYLDRNVSQPAVEERRIVYVGRMEQETTKDMLRRKFLPYGTIKQISVHYKDTGMKYGFVTFERSQDAFSAIDNSTRDPQISMYDVSFGGRRAFCRASYADLDNAGINTYQSFVFPQQAQQPKEDDSFEALLMKMKAKLNANKKPSITGMSSTTSAKNETDVGENKKANLNCTK